MKLGGEVGGDGQRECASLAIIPYLPLVASSGSPQKKERP